MGHGEVGSAAADCVQDQRGDHGALWNHICNHPQLQGTNSERPILAMGWAAVALLSGLWAESWGHPGG